MFGPPGSGKGTQAGQISNELGIIHFSTGDILRAICSSEELAQPQRVNVSAINGGEDVECDNCEEIAMEIKNLIDRGDYVPDEMMNQLLFSKLKGLDSYILDGYPRTVSQVYDLIEFMRKSNCMDEQCVNSTVELRKSQRNDLSDVTVLFLDLSEEECMKRILARGQNREDDTEEVIKHRIKVYHEKTEPVIQVLRQMGCNIQKIDANCSKAEVFENIMKAMNIEK